MLAVLAVAVSAIAGWSPASARAAAVFSVPGAAGAGPARYDRVLVERFGPASARTVLVLVPGMTSGAGVFSSVAGDPVRRVRGLQVWAVDRREQAFEDTSVIAAGDPDQALAYYLRGQPVDGRFFSPPPVSESASWRSGALACWSGTCTGWCAGHGRWSARDSRWPLAGASWPRPTRAGTSPAVPGYRDLGGLVLIHGGLPLAPSSLTAAQARAILALIRTEGPRLDVLGQRRPYLYGVLSAVAGLYADKQPQGRSPLDSVTPAPLPFQPTVPRHQPDVARTGQPVRSPRPRTEALAHAGHAAASGDPRPWIDGDITPIARLARLLTQTPINSVDWYIPRRLVELDIRAADPLQPPRPSRACSGCGSPTARRSGRRSTPSRPRLGARSAARRATPRACLRRPPALARVRSRHDPLRIRRPPPPTATASSARSRPFLRRLAH